MDYKECDVNCAKDMCIDELKKDLPFEVTLACTRKMCKCSFEIHEPII